MAALPSPTQVAGSHAAIYEAYYRQVDPNGLGRIEAMDAARFLKKSQLSDIILSKIWDMADPQSRGFLDRPGFFVALKLCALAQQGCDLNMAHMNLDINPPKMGELPKILPQKPVVTTQPLISAINNGDWSIKPTERAKYDQLFDSLQPSNGYIPGTKVKGVLMDSKLPLDTLGKIWDLADMDKDGMLDRHEFVVAMHLVYKALEKYAIPNALPPELMPPGKRKDIMPESKSPVPPIVGPPPIPPLPNVSAVNSLAGLDTKPPVVQKWVVSLEDQAAADKLFLQADMDMDGFVSGAEIKDVFLQSGLPPQNLAHIWSLCDICQSGKLNKEQFALAMYIIKQKLRGVDPPNSLTPEMVPPSLRKPSESVVENNNISGYSNPELDMISKDIAELARERHTMEQDIAQKEADIKIKNGEIKSLQSELDTLAATLRQLENQKGEAQKRLNDLKVQVDKLRQQAEEQETVLRSQEEELNLKRQELEGLKQEEQQLESQQTKSRDHLNELTKKLQEKQIQISQAKLKITHLEEQQRQMSDAIALYDSALAAGDVNIVSDTSLHYKPEIEDLIEEERRKSAQINGVNNEEDAFSNTNGNAEAFGADPFASNKAKDSFEFADPFTGSAFPSDGANSGFGNDSFASFDHPGATKQDPFDPFGDKGAARKPVGISKDPFGDDPFANLHAPTRPESPSPALPPKKAKQPPPRPAPPRPSSGPAGPTGPLRAAPAPPVPSPTPDLFANPVSDPFAAQQPVMDNNNGNSFGTGFADFANFDPKPEPVPSRLGPQRLSRTRTSSTPKLPDFTEDPFKDYRYEDPFNIDPFADDTSDSNANKTTISNTSKLDAFGFDENSFSSKDTFVRAFDSDFSKTLPSPKTKSDRNTSKFEADFGKAFSDSNRNDFTFTTGRSKPTKLSNIDETFATKNETKSAKKSNLSFRDKLVLGASEKKNKNANNKSWNGNSRALNPTEEEQIAWAEQQSIIAEEERRRMKAREDAELQMALERSKIEAVKSKKS
ncbi:epidermal growth factor receptor substrate 15-like 1 isoform X2 [Belonocnema kinseyi]|uniref:epidermal growth factor receptor substrate 15-like 1 isoform X2 n=1 Tax=Belonocnema kinseyi TaxID=2817044 RepID=UPI00143D16E8|nr:epidermal growth factor receptor substrate 15-like 1 isoform X2 [Belonocnema kinseyi]